MGVAEEVLREKPNPAAAAMAQVGAIHLWDHGGEEAAGNGTGKPQTLNTGWATLALTDIKVLEEKRNILEGRIPEEMEENELKKLLKDFSFSKETVIPGGDNVGSLCADSQCDMAAGSTNMAAGSTNMATPLTNKTVCDAAVIKNVTGKSSVTEDSLQIVEVKEHKGGECLGRDCLGRMSLRWVRVRPPGISSKSHWALPADVFGLVTVTDTEFDLSFKLSQGLDEFWRKYEGKREAPEWEGFSVIPVSKPETKTVIIIIKTVFPPEHVMVWLKSHCTVLSPLTPLYDELGFWIGGDCPNLQEEIGQRMEIVEEGAPTSEVVGSVREVVQLESSSSCSKVVGRAAEKLPKEKGEQRASQARKEKWRVVGKKTSIKKKDTSPKIVVATGNRFVLPEGKSWGDLAEEEEERLREEEKREKMKAGALGKRNRKREKRGGRRRGEESSSARQKQNRI
ncbi:hypothetical protein XELAEV_18008596mg [Xenopus laevis]|uniref:Uncharacterized protein n=1 Tax=Xenopus laevis TaxID=8355 RepID=A0A974E3Q3_XENLA|nr:hypothetical protein XELAEV_18008596mg [Xenopus laevis]